MIPSKPTKTDQVSVVLPVYNGHDYLRDCLDSVCEQTYKNLEIIVIDDASTDDSWEIIQEYAKHDERIRPFKRKVNGGQSAARNDGVAQATGEWIAFIDNDDTYELEMIETLLENAYKYDVKISGCANKRIEPDKTIIADIHGKPSGKYSAEELIIKILYKPAYTWVEIWNKIYHKSLKDKLDFPDGAQLEDYLVVLPLLYNEGVAYFDNRPLYNWIIRDTSQSEQLFFENRMTYIQSTEKLRNWFITNKASQKYINAVYTWEYGVKCKLLEDMIMTGDSENIALAKELRPGVKEVGKHVRLNREFTLKSKFHCWLRLWKVHCA